MLLGTLAASLLGNLLSGEGVIWAVEGATTTSQGRDTKRLSKWSKI